MATTRCAALGCHKLPAKNGLFCRVCWERLSEDLRAPTAFRKAMAHLGKLDGYLVDPPKKRRVTLTDNEGSEYV